MASFEFRPVLYGLEFKQLYKIERDGLEEEFFNEEIRSAIWESEGERCQGPDGYNFLF